MNVTAQQENARSRKQAWNDFLDGIHHALYIPAIYGHTNPSAADQAIHLNLALESLGVRLGSLELESSAENTFDSDQVFIARAVLTKITHHIENLRALEEAERARQTAQQSLKRMGQHGAASETPTYAIHSPIRWQPETPYAMPTPPGQWLTPIHIPTLGTATFIYQGDPLNAEDEHMARVLGQQIEQHLQNLHLLNQARDNRHAAEMAAQRVTAAAWADYLSQSGLENHAYAYGTEQRVTTTAPVDDPPAALIHIHDVQIGGIYTGQDQHDQDAQLAQIIADRVGAHIESLRLTDQREQALAETEQLYAAGSRLSAAQSLEEALTLLSQPGKDLGISESRLLFVSYDSTGKADALTLAAVWYANDNAQLVPPNAVFQLNQYPALRHTVNDADRPWLVEDIRSDPRITPSERLFFLQMGAQGFASLPLVIGTRWVGVVWLQWSVPYAFSASEKRLYEVLARQAAVVVNNRILLDQTRKRAQELQIVAQVSTAASTILNPAELLQSVVDLTKASFSLYHAQVYLFRSVEQTLEVSAGSGEVGRLLAGTRRHRMLESDSPPSRAARERRTIIVNDLQTESKVKPWVELAAARSELSIPMIVGDRLLGVFDVLSELPNRFNREDARIYNTLATQVAVALQNAELYTEQIATVERLRELDQLKSAFLANMSHELRTPLNSILGFSDVLLLGLDGELNDVMIHDVSLIHKNGNHLLSLINDVLDMAKIEAGRMSLSLENFTLGELLQECIDITGSLIHEKGLSLTITPTTPLDLMLRGDRVRLRQVVINLISNGVKFTQQGGITIDGTHNGGRVTICFRDTGMGIAPDKLEMIFEAFSQIDSSTTRKTGGTGLGLPISRRLVEMHHGRLWAESTGVAGEGTCLIIDLPLQAGVK